jgi:branched-chain amino acid transport system permease protein
LQYLFSGLSLGSIYTLVAIGFTIIFSSTQVVNFAQGEFVMLGAMCSFWLLVQHHLPTLVAVPAAIGISAVVGGLLGWLIMRPLKNASVSALIIITVGASMLLQGIASHLWGKDAVSVPPFSSGAPIVFTLPGARYPVVLELQQLWVIGLAAITMFGLSLFFNHTLVGKAMRAVADNRHGARLVGINVSRMVIVSFALSAAMGALAGAAIAPICYGSFNMGSMMGLKGFAAAIVGGLGNFPGSIVAGLLLGISESFAGHFSSDYKDAFAFVLLLAVLIIRPSGLLTFRRKKRGA